MAKEFMSIEVWLEDGIVSLKHDDIAKFADVLDDYRSRIIRCCGTEPAAWNSQAKLVAMAASTLNAVFVMLRDGTPTHLESLMERIYSTVRLIERSKVEEN